MKKNKVNKFPSIYLNFTEYILKNKLILVALVIVVFCLFIVSLDFLRNIFLLDDRIEKKEKLIEERIFWENVVKKYPDYRDGYFNLAILEYRLQDFNKTEEYLNKALRLDPNFDEARRLKEEIRN
ncbi:MAG: hypothetical protein HYT09_01380 [Candidatus Levybacteria bacterium]|nr:hypothetical protein [Candidatus Levybacteria bacterium]